MNSSYEALLKVTKEHFVGDSSILEISVHDIRR